MGRALGQRSGHARTFGDLRQRGLDRAQKTGTRRIEHHPAATPLKQHKTQLLFELLDLLANGAVRHMQLFRRSPQARKLGYGQERGQYLQGDSAHPGKYRLPKALEMSAFFGQCW